MLREVREIEAGLVAFVEVVKLERLEVANQDVARSLMRREAVEVRTGLLVGAYQVTRTDPAVRQFLGCNTERSRRRSPELKRGASSCIAAR